MKITMCKYDTNISYEGPDGQPSDEVIKVIMGMMQILTWSPDVIINSMKEIIKDYENTRNK